MSWELDFHREILNFNKITGILYFFLLYVTIFFKKKLSIFEKMYIHSEIERYNNTKFILILQKSFKYRKKSFTPDTIASPPLPFI